MSPDRKSLDEFPHSSLFHPEKIIPSARKVRHDTRLASQDLSYSGKQAAAFVRPGRGKAPASRRSADQVSDLERVQIIAVGCRVRRGVRGRAARRCNSGTPPRASPSNKGEAEGPPRGALCKAQVSSSSRTVVKSSATYITNTRERRNAISRAGVVVRKVAAIVAHAETES